MKGPSKSVFLRRLARLVLHSLVATAFAQLTGALTPEASEKIASFGVPRIEKFYPRETGVRGEIHSITTLPNGELAVLTSLEINAFDGTRWSRIEGLQWPTRALVQADSSALVSGAHGMASLKRDETGRYRTTQLTSEADLDGPVYSIDHLAVARGSKFGLHGTTLIEIDATGNQHVHRLPNWASSVFAVDDELYLTGGLESLVNRWDWESKRLVDHSHVLNDSLYEWVEHVTPRAEGGVWMLTEHNHVIGFDGQKSWSWPGNATLDARASAPRCFVEIRPGALAIGTVAQGLLLFDEDGQLQRQISKAHGLDDVSIAEVSTDAQGGIWVANETALARINLNEQSLLFDERHGLPDTTQSIAFFNNRIYLSTPNGIYASNPNAESMGDLFERVLEQRNPTGLYVHDGLLFVAGPKLYAIRPDQTHYLVSDTGASAVLSPSEYPGTLIGSHFQGLKRFAKREGRWTEIASQIGPNRECFNFAESSNGEIFASLGTPEIARIHVSATDTRVEILPIEGNLDGSWSSVVEINGELYLNTRPCLRWNSENQSFEEAPEMVYYVGAPPYGFESVFGGSPEDAHVPIDLYQGKTLPRPGFNVVAEIAKLGNGIETRANALQFDDSGYCWSGGTFGLFRALSKPRPSIESLPRPRIRSLISLSDRSQLPIEPRENGRLSLEPKNRSLRIEAAFPQFQDSSHNLYQIYIEGLDTEWPVSSVTPFREVTNLPPGNYTIRVNASTPASEAYGINIPTYDLPFRLIPPWYQRPWAYLLFALVALTLIYAIVRFYNRQHIRRQRHLEKLVADRTQEIARKNAELETQAERLERQNEELEHKTEELTSTTEALTATLQQLQEMQEQLVATARTAGKAEIAINVLHNVGNALNSINVSLSVLTKRVGASKVAKLTKLAALVESHRDSIEEFLTQNPRGKALPEYLVRLSNALEDEVEAVLHELSVMEDELDHVKRIIAAQQSHAQNKELYESFNLASVVNSALSIIDHPDAPQNLEIVDELQTDLSVFTDKHRLIEILHNLLTNARDAIEAHAPPLGLITLSTEKDPSEKTFELRIADNGIGIAPDAIKKLFQHGYTTKSNGHGFGLHSAAINARVLGGQLEIVSEGLGTGATAILTLPLARPTENQPTSAANANA